MKITPILATILALVAPGLSARAAPASPLRLYALDCGKLELSDMAMFSDTGEHAGEPGTMAVPCYLIHHGKTWLLWDTGLGDQLAALPFGEVKMGGRWTVKLTLVSQLAEIGLKPDDITYVALSHLHADHTGNVTLFPRATFLVGQREIAWSASAPLGTDAAVIATLVRLHVDPVTGDRDIFGDGTVRMLAMPGHTPGHSALLVTLPKSGAVMLSGDLFHSRENYEKSLVPEVNVDRAATIASFDRFRRIAVRTRARVVVQHALEDFAAMPPFPAHLD